MEKDNYHFSDGFKKLTDEQLIDTFNRQVKVKAWGNARSAYIKALKEEFLTRNFDSSLIITTQSFSFAKKVKLQNKHLEFVEDELE